MWPTQRLIGIYADRIERAYEVRRPTDGRARVSARVWIAAAEVLLSVHENDRSVAPDPELFVASQPMHSLFANPWTELAGKDAGRRYRRQISLIIRSLRRELRSEIRYVERKVGLGEGLQDVLSAPSFRLSPLGRYIVAHRYGRHKLAQRFHAPAAEQHASCPLYQQACQDLLPSELYPDSRSNPETVKSRPLPEIHLN